MRSRFFGNNVNSDIFFDTVKRKSLAIVGGVVLAVLIISAAVWIAPFALVRSGTEVVGDVLSPDGKWDVVLMVRNGGATTDYSTQLSVIPAVGRLCGKLPWAVRGTCSSQTAITEQLQQTIEDSCMSMLSGNRPISF